MMGCNDIPGYSEVPIDEAIEILASKLNLKDIEAILSDIKPDMDEGKLCLTLKLKIPMDISTGDYMDTRSSCPVCSL